jgi:hypothetical protein
VKQNLAAIVVLVLTVLALWKLWPARPTPKLVEVRTPRRAEVATLTEGSTTAPSTAPTTTLAPGAAPAATVDAQPEPAAYAAGPNSEGHLEAVNGTRVVGWAWDKDQPDLPIQVEISDGVHPPVLKTAAKFRVDLQKAGIGDGRHCFVVDFAGKWKPGLSYTVHVKIVGASGEIKGSPMQTTLRSR